MSNIEDWENIIHFGNLFGSIGKKTYFLALGTTPVKGVGFIAGKITVSSETAETVNFQFSNYKSMGNISCHSNQSSYPTGIKKHNFCRG